MDGPIDGRTSGLYLSRVHETKKNEYLNGYLNQVIPMIIL